jgi:hypothetical protein
MKLIVALLILAGLATAGCRKDIHEARFPAAPPAAAIR